MKTTKDSTIMTQEEFLEHGGSKEVIDLMQLVGQRVDAAIKSVTQLTEDDVNVTGLILTTAIQSTVIKSYMHESAKVGHIIRPERYINELVTGLRLVLTDMTNDMQKACDAAEQVIDEMDLPPEVKADYKRRMAQGKVIK